MGPVAEPSAFTEDLRPSLTIAHCNLTLLQAGVTISAATYLPLLRDFTWLCSSEPFPL